MELHTASAVISLAKKLENESAKFYQDLSQRYAKDEDIFLSFAKENSKNIIQIERAYYGVISDAIEGCFSFEGIDTDDFAIEIELVEDAGYSNMLNTAITMEEKILKFYSAASEISRALIRDVSRVFEKIAKKRNERIHRLRALLAEGAL